MSLQSRANRHSRPAKSVSSFSPRQDNSKYEPVIQATRTAIKESLESSKKMSVSATEASLVALSVGLRTTFEMLSVLDRGSFDHVKPRYLDTRDESKSRSRARSNVEDVRKAMFSNPIALQILQVASFTLDIALPLPAELVWKLFLAGGEKVADKLDETADRVKSSQCCTIV